MCRCRHVLAGKGDVAIQVTVDGQAANAGHVTIK
jgi:hypothetical protein